MARIDQLKDHLARQVDFCIQAFKELQSNKDPGLLYSARNWNFREIIDAARLADYHAEQFDLIHKYDKPDETEVLLTFRELKRIRDVFNGEWPKTFAHGDMDSIKTEWKEILATYRTVFVEPALDQWIQAFPALQKSENAVTSDKLKLGAKQQMNFAYQIGRMVEEGVILPPFEYDSRGNRVVNYTELARRISRLFEISGDLKNFAAHLNPRKNQLAQSKKEQIDQHYKEVNQKNLP
ncbi:MAG: hypothetical protein JNL57_11875 [Bacteroidetes bacterium]|nr:hypothetical protein [Bacteroidota bacterium]